MKYWILLVVALLIYIGMSLLSNIIEVADKVSQIHPAYGYVTYSIVPLVLALIIIPVVKVFRKPLRPSSKISPSNLKKAAALEAEHPGNQKIFSSWMEDYRPGDETILARYLKRYSELKDNSEFIGFLEDERNPALASALKLSRDQSRSYARKQAKAVALLSFMPKGGRFENWIYLISLGKIINKTTACYGFRPSNLELIKIYAGTITTATTIDTIDEISMDLVSDALEDVLGNFIKVDILKKLVANSIEATFAYATALMCQRIVEYRILKGESATAEELASLRNEIMPEARKFAQETATTLKKKTVSGSGSKIKNTATLVGQGTINAGKKLAEISADTAVGIGAKVTDSTIEVTKASYSKSKIAMASAIAVLGGAAFSRRNKSR